MRWRAPWAWCGRSFLPPWAALAGASLPIPRLLLVASALIQCVPQVLLCLLAGQHLGQGQAQRWRGVHAPSRGLQGDSSMGLLLELSSKDLGSLVSLLAWREPGSPQNCQSQGLDVLCQSLSKMKPSAGSCGHPPASTLTHAIPPQPSPAHWPPWERAGRGARLPRQIPSSPRSRH